MFKTIQDLFICISENIKKKLFFGGVRKKQVLPYGVGEGGSERYGRTP